ncbi:MAG TPA: tRNA (adenosine(37)-N6)-threonylcarbamoyltransferase complex dimerization subunit type 1 TsaB [Caulobacteraceae bacterium]|jgi:tRNA threonylcarbamoyladenosine biosynthesis protein TsaB
MTVLIIDTCLGACQVGLFDGEQRLAGASEAMQRGHQERLATMAHEVMAEAATPFSKLTRIAVTVGPGSFTGLRVGLAFAKGLHLATGCPLVGIGTLAGLAASVGDRGLSAGVIDARRGQVYLQPFRDGRALREPEATTIEAGLAHLMSLQPGGWRLIGPGAALLASPLAEPFELAAPELDALAKLARSASTDDEVSPIYLRAPDAKPMPT